MLSAILALSLMFASCSNSSDSNSDNGNNTGIADNNNNSNNSNSSGNNNSNNNSSSNNNSNNGSSNNSNSSGNNSNNNTGDNSSSTLPENVGESPIKETVKLYYSDISDRYLELKSDGTARYFRIHKEEEETEAQFAYTYNANEKTISMKVEKYFYDFPFSQEEGKLLTYNEILSKINEEATVEKVREYLRELYEDASGKENFKEEYPDCSSYDDWEKTILKSGGFASFEDYVKQSKQNYEDIHKAVFNAQTIFAYDIEDGKITLTEKFTGVKNMFMESLVYYENGESSYGGVHNNLAFIMEDDVYYTGIPNTEKKTISFVPEGGGEKVNATYTEDIAQEKVTITFNGKKYICEFYGRTFTQE